MTRRFDEAATEPACMTALTIAFVAACLPCFGHSGLLLTEPVAAPWRLSAVASRRTWFCTSAPGVRGPG